MIYFKRPNLLNETLYFIIKNCDDKLTCLTTQSLIIII